MPFLTRTVSILYRELNHAAGKQVPGDMDNDASTAALYVIFIYAPPPLVKENTSNPPRCLYVSLLALRHGNLFRSLNFVYPFGATLNVVKPAVPVLSTGTVSLPVNRPVCAFHTAKRGQGKLAVIGSVHMFSDQYFDKEENSKVQVSSSTTTLAGMMYTVL